MVDCFQLVLRSASEEQITSHYMAHNSHATKIMSSLSISNQSHKIGSFRLKNYIVNIEYILDFV